MDLETPSDDTAARLERAAEIVAGWPRTVERLLALHVEGRDGRCATCGGNGRPAPRWPCGPGGLALAARRCRG